MFSSSFELNRKGIGRGHMHGHGHISGNGHGIGNGKIQPIFLLLLLQIFIREIIF